MIICVIVQILSDHLNVFFAAVPSSIFDERGVRQQFSLHIIFTSECFYFILFLPPKRFQVSLYQSTTFDQNYSLIINSILTIISFQYTISNFKCVLFQTLSVEIEPTRSRALKIAQKQDLVFQE
eukprot:TRINITY_DN28899_c0_g1_i1.p2 TRINITY_DN28899_c0_g1~~TRINITY_DN28899_c0_g1_i1.p2  ORF type:complete len:124 (+),score=2.09 TRINITY_DN28899_c0_g1_i1:75-446(+)